MDSNIRSKSFFQTEGLILIAFSLFFIAGYINQKLPKPNIQFNKQETAININKDLLVLLSAGNKRLITDLLWVQTLIESDLDHYSGNDLKNWMYLRFLTISTLDPLFYQNYAWGGQYLSIVKDDLLGAVELMKKGLEYYPDDYRLLSNLAFAYYFELGNYEEGIKYLERIKDHPKAPEYTKSLIMKMKIETEGDYDVILTMIKDRINQSNDRFLKERLSDDFHALKSERDLRCLNSGKSGCDEIDSKGMPYIKINGVYHTKTPFLPYRLKRKGDHKETKPVTTF